jgi:predicted anti-sigma-YlaC factor YlaD
MTTGHGIRFHSLDPRCRETREAISAELDGEAAELETAAARRHRQECPDCDHFARAITETTSAVRTAPLLVPAGRPARWTRRAGRRLTAAAGLAAALVASAALGAGVASHVGSGEHRQAPRVVYVANGEPDRALVAREQMLIRRTFGQQATQRRHQRLG